MTLESFILKSDGFYWIGNMPEFPTVLNQFDPHDVAHYENMIIKPAIDSSVLVSNQDELRQALLKVLNRNPHPEEHRFDIGIIYPLRCKVDVLQWSTLRIYSKGNEHKHMPLRGYGALVTFTKIQ
jgi:hypothetical protein